MFQWTPRQPGASVVVSGFENGFLVTFVPECTDQQLARSVVQADPEAAPMLLSIVELMDGIQLVWSLCAENIRAAHEFAIKAQAIGEELVRVTAYENAA